MFGAEGERLERQRLAARSQYAADLQRQIDEANNRRDAPAFRESAANHILGLNEAPGLRPQPSINPRSDVPQLTRQHQHLPDMQQAGRPQLLQDPGSLAQRPNSLSQRERTEIVQPNPKQNPYPESARGPNDQKTAIQIKELGNKVDRIITVDIPMRIKPQEEAISALFSKVDQSSAQNRDAVQALRDKVTDLSFTVNTLTQKTNDYQDRFRSSVTELKSESNRTRDSCESLATRVGQLDARMAQVEDLVRGLISKHQQLEQNMNEQYSQMSNALSTVQKNVNSSSKHLMSQIELVNRETIATFGKVSETMQNSNVTINESIASLAKSVKESFAVVRSECDDEISALKQQLITTTEDVNQSFTALQGEVIQTFSTFRTLLESDVGTLEQCFAQEVSTRREHDQKLLDSQKSMLVGINTQITGLVEDIDRTEKAIQPRIEATCNAYFEKWKGELGSYMKDSLDSIQECKSTVDNSVAKVSDVDGRVRELATKIENQSTSFQTQLSAVSVEMNRAMQSKVDDLRKELSFENSQTQRSLEHHQETIEPRIARLEKKTAKFKTVTLKGLESRIDLLDGANVTGDYPNRIEKLETLIGAVAIPPQLEKIHAKITKTRQRIDSLSNNNLTNRVERLEHSSNKTSSMLERIVRLETIQEMLRQQPAPVAQPTVSFDPRTSAHRPRSQTSREEAKVQSEEVKPYVWSDEEPEENEEDACVGPKIVFDDCNDDVGIPSVDATVPNDEDEVSLHEMKPRAVFDEMPTNYGIPRVQLLQISETQDPSPAVKKSSPKLGMVLPSRMKLDETAETVYVAPNGYVINHVYRGSIRPVNPRPGNFILQIGQPRIVKKPGLRLLLPRRIDEFIYPPTDIIVIEPKKSDAFGNAIVGETEARNVRGFKSGRIH